MKKRKKENFLSKYFFYNAPKEEKIAIQQKVMEDDYKSTKVVLICICVLQIIMLCYSIIHYGVIVEGKMWVQLYRAFYSALGISCGAALIASKEAYTKKNTLFYFAIENIMMIVLELWGAGISMLDSFSGINLTVFAYVSVILPVFLVVKPWLSTLNLALVIILLNVHFYLNPSVSQYYGAGTIINSLSIFVLYIIASCYSFYRRVRKQKLEFQIQDLNKILERKAIIDDLTGLKNRHYLSSVMIKPLNIGKKPSAILMVDIDHFKKINDVYGHLAGDQILKALGEILLNFVGERDYAVRYGGEEFLIYLDSIDYDSLVNKAEELRKQIEMTTMDIGNGTMLNINVSIGGALASASVSYAGLISIADKALYHAKEKRNMSVITNC